MSIVISDPATIHTTVCGIYRWPSKLMKIKPGPYYSVIANMDVMQVINMNDHPYYTVHAVAVVDDFGNLVGVPA